LNLSGARITPAPSKGARMKPFQVHPLSLVAGVALVGLLGMAQSTLPGSHTQITTLTQQQREILSHMSIVYLDDGHGNLVNKTIRISGVNVQLVNGLQATNGNPLDPNATSVGLVSVNGVGNLIVGYNELGNVNGDDRTGSHNVVVGHGNSYLSFGGLVAGRDNMQGNPANPRVGAYASVTGGQLNRARSTSAVVVGGRENISENDGTTILGGQGNQVTGDYGAIVGGHDNSVTGSADWAVVAGGFNNDNATTNSVLVGPVNFLD
jgi:hypothetical protein